MPKKYIIDIDGTLTLNPDIHYSEYSKAIPNQPVIITTNQLYEKGHEIILFTARYEIDRDLTLRWLRKYDVKFHQLIMGKPQGDYFLDDRSITFHEFFIRGSK